MNTAILLSGGIGSRLHSDVPKQYIYINGRMLITYALEALVKSHFISRIMIVADEKWQEHILSDAAANNVPTDKIMVFAQPGFNRQASIINGMQEVLRKIASQNLCSGAYCKESLKDSGITEEATVFIHDAARPLLSQKQVSDCFGALAGHDGVLPVLPMKDTIYLSQNMRTVSKLLDRNRLFAGQAPELFLFKKYYNANMALTQECLAKINGSTEPAVMAGMDIVMILGDENNFKVTTKQDLERLCSLLPYYADK